MSRRNRIFGLVLVVCMLAGVLASCQTATPTNAPGVTPTVTPAPPTVLRVGIAAAGREEYPEGSGEYIDDNWSTKYIKDKFGVPNNIDIQFEIIDDTNGAYIQNYQLMMAAKKAPDLFYVTVGEIAFVSNLAINGALADLKPSLDKYGANIKSFLSEDFLNTYGSFYGQLVTVPGLEPIPAISHYWIRQDWLDALGLTMPKTFDDWYAAMKAFKTRAGELETKGLVAKAADVIPYSMYHTKWFTDWERIVSRFYPSKYFDPANEEYYIYSGYGTEYGKEGFKEGMQFMNGMYNDGLISPNFALDQDQKQFERDIVAGNAGSYCNNLFSGWGPSDPNSWHNLLKANIPAARFEWCFPFSNKYDNEIRNPLDDVVLTYAFVPVYSKVVDAAVQYLDFVSTKENMVAIQYGIEGTTYTQDPVLGPLYKDEATLKAWGHRLGGRELVMIGRLPDRTWSRIQRSGARTAEEAAYAETIHKGIEANGYMRFPLQMASVPERATYEGGLRGPWEKFIASLIMAKPGEFESAWTTGVAELEANGSAKIIEGKKKQFAIMQKAEGK